MRPVWIRPLSTSHMCSTSSAPPIQSHGYVHKRPKDPLVFPWSDSMTSETGPALSPAACSSPTPISTLPIVPPGILLAEFSRFQAVVWECDEVKLRRCMGKVGLGYADLFSRPGPRCFITDRFVLLWIALIRWFYSYLLCMLPLSSFGAYASGSASRHATCKCVLHCRGASEPS